ncbi:MAG: hypothetical protein AAB511_02360 [Patescibacteria group bacterium]
MRIWQFKASKHPERLAARLAKFNGGQLLLETETGTFRGQLESIDPLTSIKCSGDGKLEFSLIWRAQKVTLSKSVWHPKWKWELAQWNWHHASGPTPIRGCSIHVEMTEGNETGHPNKQVTEGLTAKVALKRFYQDKSAWGHGILFPKCLFFTTDRGEKGTLFQPRDPRNLVLKEDGTILDPSLPDETPPPPPTK